MDTEAIRQTLNKALLHLNPNGTWPVNLHGILSRLGIRLRFEEEKGNTASYLELGDAPTIIVHRQNPGLLLSARERFSIAHELAHWVVWRRFGSIPSSETEYWWHETLCNEFAAGLLVPQHSLNCFLERQYSEKVDPIYFPDRVKRSASVSWEVAAKSITRFAPSANSAYLRLIKIAKVDSPKDTRSQPPILKVNCSTLTNMPGSFVGQSALVRGQGELSLWMDELPQKILESRTLTLAIGNLHLKDVPCTFLREANFWIIHFCPSNEGVQIEIPNQAASK